MLPTRFNDALERLLMALARYHAVARRPDNIRGLSAARRQLDLAREEVAVARGEIPKRKRSPNWRSPTTADEALQVWAHQQRRA